MQKMLLLAKKVKSCIPMAISFLDFSELLDHIWSATEIIVVFAAVVWFPMLRFAVFLFNNFGVRIPFGIPEYYSKFLLRALYGITAAISILNYACKCMHNSDWPKMIALGFFYLIILVIDFIETEETIKKIGTDNGKNKNTK